MWDFVSSLLKDPARIGAGMERLIEQKWNGRIGDLVRESEG